MRNGQNYSSLRVGIIGCGEIAQVVHIPTLNHLREKFEITYLCDVSEQALENCIARSTSKNIKTTTDPEQLVASNEVDIVLVANATPYHSPHAVLALKHDKHVLIEKPASLTYRDLDAVVEAEKSSKGKVLVGTMRRYASAFVEAVKEVGGLEQISHVRVRDVIGPNSNFVNQSGTFPKSFQDVPEATSAELAKRSEENIRQALVEEFKVPNTPENSLKLQLLGGLGSHDLSAMRELVGVPKACIGTYWKGIDFWVALLKYDDFVVVYESGINEIPVFDCFIEVVSKTKSVRVTYDTPYVKGLPITLSIREKIDGRPGTTANGVQERVVRRTYEDPYTIEWQHFYDCITQGKSPKTSAKDSRDDLDIYKLIIKASESTSD